MNIAIDRDRLAAVTELKSGSHDPSSGEMCVMEAVAWVTHKDWTDHPSCVCPVHRCATASVPFFMKQMSKKAPIPDDLFVRQFP